MVQKILKICPTLIVVAFNNKAPDVKSSSKFLGIQVLLAPHQGQGGGLNISRTGQSNYKSILKAKPSSTISFCVGSSNCASQTLIQNCFETGPFLHPAQMPYCKKRLVLGNSFLFGRFFLSFLWVFSFTKWENVL